MSIENRHEGTLLYIRFEPKAGSMVRTFINGKIYMDNKEPTNSCIDSKTQTWGHTTIHRADNMAKHILEQVYIDKKEQTRPCTNRGYTAVCVFMGREQMARHIHIEHCNKSRSLMIN